MQGPLPKMTSKLAGVLWLAFALAACEAKQQEPASSSPVQSPESPPTTAPNEGGAVGDPASEVTRTTMAPELGTIGNGAGSRTGSVGRGGGFGGAGGCEDVRFKTADDVWLVGDLCQGASETAPAVVLLHQLGSNRSEWGEFMDKLGEDPGLTVLAIDLRGHGESTEAAGGGIVDWRSFEDRDFAKLPHDVEAAVEYLKKSGVVRPRKVVAVGSSIGGSAAIIAASRQPRIVGVAAISPGTSYRGLEPAAPAAQLGDRPLLMLVSREESPSVLSANTIKESAGAAAEVQLVDGAEHGISMFEADPVSINALNLFVRRSAGLTQ